MAAGSGFKTFATGDVLTAADTNGYLMQGVWVFADAAARTAAVTSPQEGNMSYLKDTNSTEYYSGSAWVAVSGASGGWTLASTTTLSTASTSLTIPSGYKQVVIFVDNYQINGTSYATFTMNSNAGTVYSNLFNIGANTSNNAYFGTEVAVSIGGGSTMATGNNKNKLVITIDDPDNTTSYKTLAFIEAVKAGDGTQRLMTNSTGFQSTVAVTSLQLKAGNSTWAAGTAYVYGVK